MLQATAKDYLLFTARGISVLYIGFIALFALDVFSQHLGVMETLKDLAFHLLPSLLLLVVFLASLKREWIASLTYFAIALAYTVVSLRHPDWILVIAGPLYTMSILYAIVWFRK